MDELKKTRLHIPCPARSVSLDHNAETAYFEVPVGTSHGVRLICRHPDCAKKKSKRPRFRYCAICNTAVSYKNFHLRHSHIGDPKASMQSFGCLSTPSTKDSSNIVSIRSQQQNPSIAQRSQLETEWLELLHEHPTRMGYASEDTQLWIDAIRVVTPVAFQNWITSVLNLPASHIRAISAYKTPSPIVRGGEMEMADESVTSTTSSGYFSEF